MRLEGTGPLAFATVTSARERVQVGLAYLSFVVIGMTAGATGVLLPAQMRGYAVDRPTIGTMFFTFSAGFALAGVITGPLVHGAGFRWALVGGNAAALVAGLATAAAPAFWLFVAVQLLAGLGIGILESVLNTHLTTLPRSAVRLGRMHACFGLGALAGPLVATWLLRSHDWPAVVLVTSLPFVPLLAAMVVAHAVDPEPPVATPGPSPVEAADTGGVRVRTGLLAVLRERPVVLAAAFLAVYTGLEATLGDWAFSYLVEDRGRSDLVAGNAVSGYWLGLTLGRVAISPLAERVRWSVARTSTACLLGVVAAAAGVWLVPSAGAAAAGLALLGFFLGPLFPTTMAIMPQVTSARSVAAAIGLLNAASVIGGSVLPWLAGALTQGIALWTLLPYVAALGLVQLDLWLPLTRHTTAPPSS